MRDWLQKVVSDDEVNFTPYKDVPEITDYSDSICRTLHIHRGRGVKEVLLGI